MDEWLRLLPPGACCFALSEQAHPVAFKDPTGKYIGANRAFEDLLGYSNSELAKIRWQDITCYEDIYGEQSSFEQIQQGLAGSYMATKRYKHKLGHYVSVSCVVRRWPNGTHEPIGCYIVDVSLEVCTISDLRDAREQTRKEIDEIRARMQKMTDHGEININTSSGNNSDRAIIVLGGVVIVMAIVLAWMAYYVFGNPNMSPPPTPQVTQVSGTK